MSMTPSAGSRSPRRMPTLTLAVVVAGVLAPTTGQSAAAQTEPSLTAHAATALLDRPARLRVRNVSLADALAARP